MKDLNVVIEKGRLTRDPELRYDPSGLAICKIGLAVNRSFKRGGEWVEEPVFIDVTMFGKTGEALGTRLYKGDPVLIQGELRFDTWEDKNTGQKRSKLYVVAHDWWFISAKKETVPQEEEEYDPESSPF